MKRQIILFAIFLLTIVSVLSAQTIITGGTTLKVSGGTTLTEDSPLGITSAGVIDNQGTINLKGNLVNNGTPNLGTGTFVFNGTASQTITGVNNFNHVTVNNSAGVVLAGNTRIDGTLTLTSGRITLGTNNLTLGGSAPAVAGTLSASNMIVATGTGELRKEFSSTGSYVFPVGDNTGTAEYSPVTLSFSSGTYGAGAYAGVNLVDDVYSDPNIAVDYITRYWNLSQSGITAFDCQATFNYTDADINGTESNIYTVKINPAPVVSYDAAAASTNALVAPGLTGFSTFTGMRAAHAASFTAYLEGPYFSGSMSTSLNSSGLIPLNQPYNTAPWNYAGTESVLSIPAGVVDWVLVELRQATSAVNATAATVFSRKAGFIKSDGSIVSTDGVSPLRFDNAAITGSNNLYTVIRHRNHMAIMSNNAVTKTNGIYTYDFSDNISKIYPGNGMGYKNLLDGHFGLYAGDANASGFIDNSDFGIWESTSGSSNYNSGDFTLSGYVDNSDYGLWEVNSGNQSQIPN